MSQDYASSAQAEVERATKKQRTCAVNAEELLDQVIGRVEAALASLSGVEHRDAVVEHLQEFLSSHVGLKGLYGDTKELHGSVFKLGKIVERHFSLDICKAMGDFSLDRRLLDQIIIEHLFHEGFFDVGDTLAAEASIPNASELGRPYAAMHEVLQQIRQKNLAPVLEWVRENAAQLEGPNKEPSTFEFHIRQLEYLQLLEKQGQCAALAYAREHFPRFQMNCMPQVQRLMGVLAFLRRPQRSGPYADIFGDDLWSKLELEFVRQSCALLGQAQDSPLLVTVAAGATALPTLLKLVAVAPLPSPPETGATPETYQLPVEIPLGSEFMFHSIFACPVSRDQSTAENPPVMLPCGHCMCSQSIMKIAKTMNRSFKCPYCPAETTAAMCKELHFPDIS